ncbi:MAG: ATP-dependent DNA helicase RecG [Elusimicrobia bacterium]|nr:ATP-dependent DNA helicase RecG [Elusimicrobiota bacterium]
MGQSSTSEAAILDRPARYLKGVGPRRADALARLGVATLGDLLANFPRGWQDRSSPMDLGAPTEGTSAVVRGRVLRAEHFQSASGMAIFKARLKTATGEIDAVWFKHSSRRYDVFAPLKRDVVAGREIWAIGRCETGLLGPSQLQVEEHYLSDDPLARLHVGRIVPLYSLTAGVSQRMLRELTAAALELAESRLRDILPPGLLSERGLPSYPKAVRSIHFPDSQAELEAARGRLAYEELLILELAWMLKRRQTKGSAKGYGYEITRRLLTPFRAQLGFDLTGAQKRVINEIFDDLRRPQPMTRLLQGDVGSGKTVVALSALLLAVENGGQGAFMAPTEILADQHLATLRRFLAGLPVRSALLTSRLKTKERSAVLARIQRGEIDIVVGTHALLESDVRFPRLRLAVIDEQHRFGVRQRASLRRKSAVLDLLVMTATPIPRTLALALYGDLDVSTLDEMPPGKTAIRTAHAGEADALAALTLQVAAGHQAYVVYPIIEESSRLDLRSAKKEFERLRLGPLAGLKVALIHGAMPGPQKARIMNEFAAGAWQVLVATPVIEVGIDVPNATVMIVQNADRFGMASLHQLRGRIGRGRLPSTCFLVAAPKTPQARQRLATLAASNDGFRIGEEDLKLRGPGDFMGTEQHGELGLKIANMFKDAAALADARADAERALQRDPRLLAPEHAGLRGRLLALYHKNWGWVDLA